MKPKRMRFVLYFPNGRQFTSEEDAISLMIPRQLEEVSYRNHLVFKYAPWPDGYGPMFMTVECPTQSWLERGTRCWLDKVQVEA